MKWSCFVCLPKDFATCHHQSVVIQSYPLSAANRWAHQLLIEHIAWVRAWSIRSLLRSILASTVFYFCSSFYTRNWEKLRISTNVLKMWVPLFLLFWKVQRFSLISDYFVFYLYANDLLRILWFKDRWHNSILLNTLATLYLCK